MPDYKEMYFSATEDAINTLVKAQKKGNFVDISSEKHRMKLK